MSTSCNDEVENLIKFVGNSKKNETDKYEVEHIYIDFRHMIWKTKTHKLQKDIQKL